MADESLNIEIKASAQQASASIDTLVKKLDKLSSVLNGVKGNGLQKFASGMSMLSNSMQKFQNVNAASFNRVAKGIKKFEDIDGSKISSVANGLNPLANSIQTLGNISFNSRNLSSAINSITRLSNANLSNVNSADFVRVGQAITNLSSTLSSAQEVSKNTIAMTVAIARLGSAGQSVNAVTAALPNLSAKLRDFINTMSTANTVDEKIISFTTAIGTLASAGSKTRTTVLNLDALASKLKDFMSTMRTAPNVSENTIRMTQALAQLASTGAYSGRTINSLRNAMSSSVSANGQYSNSLKRITASLKELNAHVKNGFGNVTSFTKNITSAIGIVGGLYGAIQGLRKSMDISSDLVEVQNVIDNTFAQYKKGIEDFSKTSITDYGMSELTAKTMAGRFQAMGTAAGIARKQMADMSVSITGLAADMASFYNMGQEDVATSLQAIFTGETEPLRRFGLDLTQATLQEWALKNGLDADMRSMTAAQKIMLRYQYVMANTSEVQGDFARTSDSWANSVRILKQQFEQLAIIIGGVFVNAFKPAVAAMNGFMTSVLNFAQTVADALGSIFGWTIDIQNVKIIDEATTSAETASAGIADNTKKAADNAKKLNKQLAKFDELNLFTTSKGTDSDSGKGKNGTPASGIGASGTPKLVETENISKKIKSGIKDFEELGKYVGESLAKALDKIEWDDIKAKAKKIGEEVGNLINGFISVPNLGSEIGKAIANSIDTAVTGLDAFFKKVHWNEVGEFIADGVNSIFTSDLLPDAASLLADSLNAAFQTIDGFQKKFKWEKAGKTICKSFNKFFKKWDAKEAGLSVAGLVSGIATTVYTVVADKKTWSNLGQKVADGINGFFKGMNKVNKDTGLTGWQTLGKNISSTISGIATSITTALNGVDWESVGKSIADFISSINWQEIAWNLGEMAKALIKAIGETIVSATKEDPVSGIITVAITGWILKAGWKKLLSTTIGTAIANSKFEVGISMVSAVVKKWKIAKKAGKIVDLISKVKKALGITKGTLNLGTVVPKISVKFPILIFPDPATDELVMQIEDWFTNEVWKPLCKEISWLDENSDFGVFQIVITPVLKIGQGIGDWFKDVWKDTTLVTDSIDVGNEIANGILKGIADALVFPAQFIYNLVVQPFKDALDIHSPSKKFQELGNFCVEGLLKGFDGLFGKIKEKIKDAWEKVCDWWGSRTLNIVAKVSEWKNDLKDWWKNVKKWWGDKALAIKTTISDLKNEIKEKWNDVKDWWGEKTLRIKLAFDFVKDKMKSAINTIIGWINKYIIKNLNKISIKIPEIKIAGKKLFGGKTLGFNVPDIQTFESGGFPEKADLFFANENGVPEMVGRMGQRTAVANNGQIAEGISDAVLNALAPSLTAVANAINSLAAGSGNGQPLYVEGVSDGDIVKITTRANADHKKRYGTPLYT